jgi:hypothetical protein
VTSGQCIAARRLLGWSRDRLGAASNVGPSAIRIYEVAGLMPVYQSGSECGDRRAAILCALRLAGIEFIDSNPPSVSLLHLPEP